MTDNNDTDDLYARGRQVLPGGVCSSTRWNAAWGKPVYAKSSRGSRFVDVEDREFIDMSMSHGAALLGHAPDCVKQAFDKAWECGILGSLDSEYHIELAEQICRIVPSSERVRFTNSGSEATLHALRLCRAASGRDKVIRFFGHFHGYHEFTFVGGHPPQDQMNVVPAFRESPGIPESLAELIIPVEYNDLDALEAVLKKHAHEAGTLLIEPIDFNCGCILPEPGFLQAAQQLAKEHDLILFFDEIQSFAKKSPGGAQEDFGVTPDICTIGKSLGASLPLSAICGKAELMDQFKPTGDVAHSGTFNAPLPNVLAGLGFVQEISTPEFWQTINDLGDALFPALEEIQNSSPVPVRIQHHGSRFGIVFGTREPVTCYSDTFCHTKEAMIRFCAEATARGVYFHDYGGGACHHGYSSVHTKAEVLEVAQVIEDSLRAMA
jgi:glutamate-1-semialdehyde 2,1-aminomutase